MKNAHEIVIQSAAKAAAAIGLGLLASAQTTGGGEPRHGQPLLEGSFENDIREGRGPRQVGTPEYWGEVVVDLASDLSLTVRLMGNEEIDPAAVLPLPEDLAKLLVLEGGAPGHVAMIEIGPRTRGLQHRGYGLAGGAVISGFFGENGEFEVELPSSLDVRGLGLRAAQISGRTVTEVVDLEEAVEAAFASFDPLGSVANPPRAIGGGSMQELRKPSQGSGHAAQARITGAMATRTVDLSDDIRESPVAGWQDLGDVAKPDRIGPGGAHDLQKPSSGAGHGARASAPTRTATRLVDLSDDIVEEEEFASWQKIGDVAKPDRAGSGGSMNELRRLSRRGPRSGQQ